MMSEFKLFTKVFIIIFALVKLTARGHSAVFTDEDLHSLLHNQRQGMILVWSHDMPLSVLSYQEAPEIAQVLNFHLVTIRHEDMRSEELASHGILNHFPAIMIYRDGRLLPFLIQGYEPPTSLQNILKDIQ